MLRGVESLHAIPIQGGSMSSIFATKSTPAEQVAELVDNLDHYVTPEGIIRTKEVATQPIKYSRAWLILRRAYLEAHAPKLLEKELPAAQVAKIEKTHAATNPDWRLRFVTGPVVVRLHDEGCSWGEIMVRMGLNEGVVRKAFEKAQGDRKSVGLRTGKGGRFVGGRGDLYTENRQAEGAAIPLPLRVSEVEVEQLLNFEPANA
jgi:hypothetical protein